jgi:hypothetical protein
LRGASRKSSVRGRRGVDDSDVAACTVEVVSLAIAVYSRNASEPEIWA